MPETKIPFRYGKLIVIEGVDGAGKSTLIKNLRTRLSTDGYKVLVSEWRESRQIGTYLKGLASTGHKLCPRAFSALHAADFADRLHCEILPALEKGTIVICDRYSYTEFARDAGLGLPADWSRDLFAFAPQPDLVLYLDISLRTSLERVRRRMKEVGKGGSFSRSLQTALLGSLLSSLDTTTGLLADPNYRANGEPLTVIDREKVKFSFQLKVKETYQELFSQSKNTCWLDAERREGEVLLNALKEVDLLLERDVRGEIFKISNNKVKISNSKFQNII